MKLFIIADLGPTWIFLFPVESQEGLKPIKADGGTAIDSVLEVESQEGLKQNEAVVVIHRPYYCLYVESQEGLKRISRRELSASALVASVESQEGLKLYPQRVEGVVPPDSRISRRVETMNLLCTSSTFLRFT